MSDPMPPEEFVAAAQSKVCVLAQAILNERVSVLDGTYEMHALLSQSGLPVDDPIYRDFVRIHTEIEHLPIGPQKHLWAPVALARLGPELDSACSWAKPIAFRACRSLLTRLGAPHLVQPASDSARSPSSAQY